MECFAFKLAANALTETNIFTKQKAIQRCTDFDLARPIKMKSKIFVFG